MSSRSGSRIRSVIVALLACAVTVVTAGQSRPADDDVAQLKKLVADLQKRVAQLERQNAQTAPQTERAINGPQAAEDLASATMELRTSNSGTAPAMQAVEQPSSQSTPSAAVLAIPATLPGGVTLNYAVDGYYEYNWNRPIGRANDLRAYDVLSNAFSINQAALIFSLDPDVSTGRRYGLRFDLQFGQASETSQGNPANESRPDVYRNIYQAFGTYVVPVGRGLNVDFGKWASSLGSEGNYTKDQMNYTRSFYFYFLPFYHAGFRTSYHVNDKLALNYWLVNGVNQAEPTRGFKDELFGYVLQPAKSVTWTMNYYFGDEHADSTPATGCPNPLQPGLCATPISPVPDGKLHIFDTYATWQATPKLTFQAEADYVIQREWANAAPGQSSAPARVDGGAGYAQYQLTPHSWLAARGEYFDDHGGMFSGKSQVLNEITGTYEQKLGDGFATFLEFRRDWSDHPYFTTSHVGVLAGHQTTAALGMVWWYGGKEGSW